MSKFEAFKCLVCGKKFKKPKEEWVKLNEELKKVNDPDKVKNKIECPQCRNTKLQHLVKKNINIFKSLFSFINKIIDLNLSMLGNLAANTLIFINRQVGRNIDIVIEYVIGFVGILVATYLTSQYLKIDVLWSLGVVFLFFIIKKLLK